MFSATVLAVSGVPSEQVTPLRSVYFAVVVVPSHFSASPATCLPLASTLSSASYRNQSTCLVTDSEVNCGSRLPGSPLDAIVSVLPATG